MAAPKTLSVPAGRLLAATIAQRVSDTRTGHIARIIERTHAKPDGLFLGDGHKQNLLLIEERQRVHQLSVADVYGEGADSSALILNDNLAVTPELGLEGLPIRRIIIGKTPLRDIPTGARNRDIGSIYCTDMNRLVKSDMIVVERETSERVGISSLTFVQNPTPTEFTTEWTQSLRKRLPHVWAVDEDPRVSEDVPIDPYSGEMIILVYTWMIRWYRNWGLKHLREGIAENLGFLNHYTSNPSMARLSTAELTALHPEHCIAPWRVERYEVTSVEKAKIEGDYKTQRLVGCVILRREDGSVCRVNRFVWIRHLLTNGKVYKTDIDVAAKIPEPVIFCLKEAQ